MSPIVGATSIQMFQLIGRSDTNAAEHTRTMIQETRKNLGAIVITPVINARIDGERGNLVSLIA